MMKISMIRIVCMLGLLSFFGEAKGAEWAPQHKDRELKPEECQQIEAALPAVGFSKNSEPRKLLVYSATGGFRHKSIPYGKYALQKMGVKTKLYETVISDELANFEPENIKQFDAICFLNNTRNLFEPGKKEAPTIVPEDMEKIKARAEKLRASLYEYVRNGGGVVGIHAATDACYDYKEYGDMMGAYFAGHPWKKTANVTIRVEDPTHAIMAPVFKEPDFSIQEEIYQFREEPYSRDKLRILLALDLGKSDKPTKPPKRKDNDYAVSWVQKFGEGRVMYTSIGHNPHIFWNPLMLKHYLAGIQFAFGDIEADTTPSNKIKQNQETP